ncbi:Uncharacterised protein [uncultured archaeon]|nr:Uncharacterised protein [uncultured archaeon]
MGFSTSNAKCQVSGHRAKVIRQNPDQQPQLVKNLLYDKFPKFSTLDENTKNLIQQEVLKAVEDKCNSYSLRPGALGGAGVWEIAKHAIPVGVATSACGYTAIALGQPVVQDALQGHWGKVGVRLGIGVVLAYSAWRIVKDIFHSGALHAPLAREINEAAVYSISQHAPRENAA